MSLESRQWAKATRGHRSPRQKFVLVILADYYDPEKGYAWPSQKMLAADTEMPLRTVKWCLDKLEQAGFISVLQKGNQYQETRYQLHMDVIQAVKVQPLHLQDKSEGARFKGEQVQAYAPSSEGARTSRCKDEQVKVQGRASEGASAVHTNRKNKKELEIITTAAAGANLEIPEWLQVLHHIAPPDPSRDKLLIAWAANHDPPVLFETAHSLVQKWAQYKARRKDPRGTFQGWVRLAENSIKERGNGHERDKPISKRQVDDALANY